MKRLFFYLIQWTWGLPQNLAGFFMFLVNTSVTVPLKYRQAIVIRWRSSKSLSLGMFIFLGENATRRILKHEYGHSIQSMILGPLYLFAVGIPSILWCDLPPMEKLRKEKGISYYSKYPENWADKLGGVLKPHQPMTSGGNKTV